MIRALFNHVDIQPHYVLIRDLGGNNGHMTVTNDAEAVVEFELEQFGPERRIFYYDSEGELGELCHDGKRFTKFGFVSELPKGEPHDSRH